MELPTRSTDETDDPYSTILFSDIKDLLISLTSVEAKQRFRLVWLSFLGLRIPGFSESLSDLPFENMDDRWCHTHLHTPSYLRSIFPLDVMTSRITAESHSGVLVGGEKQYSDSFGPVPNWGYGVVGPFDDRHQVLWSQRDVSNIRMDFVRRVFQQCRMGNDDMEWDSFAIAFEAALNMKKCVELLLSFSRLTKQTLALPSSPDHCSLLTKTRSLAGVPTQHWNEGGVVSMRPARFIGRCWGHHKILLARVRFGGVGLSLNGLQVKQKLPARLYFGQLELKAQLESRFCEQDGLWKAVFHLVR